VNNALCPTLSMMVTYQCNIECRHCGPLCGPSDKEWMTLDEMKDLIQQAGALGAKNVVFTGGEPTLLGPRLNDLLEYARTDIGIGSCRIVTNAAWAKSYDRAKELLRGWKDSGLDEVNISCGEFHLEFVPLEHVANAYRAAVDLGYKTVLLIAELLKEGRGDASRRRFAEVFGEHLPSTSAMSPFSTYKHGLDVAPAMAYGRGAAHIAEDDLLYHANASIGNTCSDILTAITVHPNGNVTGCCGIMCREESLLTIGNWRERRLRDILEDADGDLVLNWIKYVGLNDMREWLLDKDQTIALKARHQNICDLCADILRNPHCQSVLSRAGAEREADITVNRVAHEAVFYGPQRFRYQASVPPDGASGD
jgi:hypothetical protein